MPSRLDQLCDLVANKKTTTDRIHRFLAAEKLDINEGHSYHSSRPIEFASQSGSKENVQYLHELGASISAKDSACQWNVLQWAHDDQASSETRKYFSDLNEQRWRAFDDGTLDLHIYCYHGLMPQVEAILAGDPAAIVLLAKDKFSPYYWAVLGGQEAMQTYLLEQLTAYKTRHADNDLRLLKYHTALLFAGTAPQAPLKPYEDFNAFIELGKRLTDNSDHMTAMFDNLLRDYIHFITIKLNTLDKNIKIRLKKRQAITLDENAYKNIIASIQQVIAAVAAIAGQTEQEEVSLLDSKFHLVRRLVDFSQHTADLLDGATSQDDPEWPLIQRYMDAIYEYTEDGLLQLTTIPDSVLVKASLEEKSQLRAKLMEAQEEADKEEDALQYINGTFQINRKPLRHFIYLLEQDDTTIAQIDEFLSLHPTILTESYLLKPVIDIAVAISNTAITLHLIRQNPSILAIPADSNRRNLMWVMLNEAVPEIKHQILNVEDKIWEHFQDGTTDLHAHAYVGRVEEVKRILLSDDARMYECTTHKENVFYWAHVSGKQADFARELKPVIDNFLQRNIAASGWDVLLKYFQAMRKYYKEVLSPAESHECRLINAKMITSLIIDKECDSQKILLADFVNSELVKSYLKMTPNVESGKGADVFLKAEAAFQLNLDKAKQVLAVIYDQEIKQNLGQYIVEALSLSFYREASTLDEVGNEAHWIDNNEKAMANFILVIEKLVKANACLRGWTSNLEEKAKQAKVIEEFRKQTQTKLDTILEFPCFPEDEYPTPKDFEMYDSGDEKGDKKTFQPHSDGGRFLFNFQQNSSSSPSTQPAAQASFSNSSLSGSKPEEGDDEDMSETQGLGLGFR